MVEKGQGDLGVTKDRGQFPKVKDVRFLPVAVNALGAESRPMRTRQYTCGIEPKKSFVAVATRMIGSFSNSPNL